MTLGSAASAHVRLNVWCARCSHQAEPDPSEMADHYGAETSMLDRRDRLVCFAMRRPEYRDREPRSRPDPIDPHAAVGGLIDAFEEVPRIG
jgi:hypothetical protein